jgi:hypothetical protein
MKRSPGPSRRVSNLSQSAHKHLTSYTLAATAAGVSLLALTAPSEAEIVYTPANGTITRDGSYAIDLNHDGIVDFVILEKVLKQSPNTSFQSLGVQPGANNQADCRYPFCGSTGGVYAGALSLGNEIGPSSAQHGWSGEPKQMAAEIRSGTFLTYLGDFRYARGAYLGLRFQINGETHFGWARLTVRFLGGLPKDRTWEAHITGYAYETVADKAIKAGETGEDAAMSLDSTRPGAISVSRVQQQAPLGTLALGAEGIALLRRQESEITIASAN